MFLEINPGKMIVCLKHNGKFIKRNFKSSCRSNNFYTHSFSIRRQPTLNELRPYKKQSVMRIFFVFLVLSLGINQLRSQHLTVTVVDAKTGAPIPFATVVTGKHSGLITNDEGVFAITERQLVSIKDSIFISSMGYEKVGLWQPRGETTISLVPKTFELAEVFLNANPLTATEVIEKVKENTLANYTITPSKKKIFFRQSDLNIMTKVDFGFKKSSIDELNEELFDEIAASIPRKSMYYKEAVGDFYGDYNSNKLHIDKAAELYDKNKDISMDGLSDRLERIFKENVKPDSYLKIRSGLIGTKIELDSISNENKEETAIIKAEIDTPEKTGFQADLKDRISELFEQLFFNEDSELDILEKSNRYEFTHKDYTFIDDSAVYIIGFEPKGKKKFKGVLYVNAQDYAVMRLEFENVRPLNKFGMLGISYSRSVFKGKMLFAKESKGGYGVSYMELEDGITFGVDRPLNVIEKNKHVKGRRKQNELALHLDIGTTNISKYELVVFSSENISDDDFKQASENPDVKPSYLSKYDPDFWKEYTIMEPNAAIQAFEVLE
ncbi:MAG: hypothetical protein ACJA1Z_000730 [Patiriisocius sp.]|jgi:hypothetical protein